MRVPLRGKCRGLCETRTEWRMADGGWRIANDVKMWYICKNKKVAHAVIADSGVCH